jgi:hypothetical protein
MYAPPWAREKLPAVPVVPADDRPTGQLPQSLGADAVGPMFSGDIAARLDIGLRLLLNWFSSSQSPSKSIETGRLLRVSYCGAVAWALVSLPGVDQRAANNNTAVPPSSAKTVDAQLMSVSPRERSSRTARVTFRPCKESNGRSRQSFRLGDASPPGVEIHSDDPKHALGLVQYLRTIGYEAWLRTWTATRSRKLS